jgi:MFS family permease
MSPAVRRIVTLAWVANFLHSLAFHTYLHVPGWLDDMGADELGIGLIMAIPSVAAVLARPTIGVAMDRFGRVPLVRVGGVLNVATAGGYLMIDSIGPELVALRVLHGAALGVLFSVLFTVAADVIPAASRARGLAWFGISGMLPLGIGGVMGDWVLARGTYVDLFWVIGACAIAGLLLSLGLGETRPTTKGGHRAARPRFFAALWLPRLRPLWLVGLGFATPVAGYFVFLKSFVLDTGGESIGHAFAAYSITAITLRVLFGGLPDRVGMERVLHPSLVLTMVGLAWLGFDASPFALLGGSVLIGAGHGFAFPIISAMVVERTPDQNRGSAVALFTALFDIGVLAAGPSFGLIAREVGFAAMWFTAAVVVGLSAIVFAVWDPRARANAS